MLALPAWSVSAQDTAPSSPITVEGQVPADLTAMGKGPQIDGVIAARSGEQLRIAKADGTSVNVLVSAGTDIRSTGGLLNANRMKVDQTALLNGLPVSVQTVQWGGNLVASKVRFKSTNLATAAIVRSGTAQRFGEHDTQIAANAAATEALRGRVAVQLGDGGQDALGAGHVKGAGREQEIELRIHIEEHFLHTRAPAKFLRVWSTSRSSSWLCSTGHGSVGSNSRRRSGSLASEAAARSRAFSTPGTGASSTLLEGSGTDRFGSCAKASPVQMSANTTVVRR
jgi:hypothetical protein